MARTYEDGVLAALAVVNELDPKLSEKVLARVMSVSLYQRAKKRGKLRESGIARMARVGQQKVDRYTVVTGNQTRH